MKNIHQLESRLHRAMKLVIESPVHKRAFIVRNSSHKLEKQDVELLLSATNLYSDNRLQEVAKALPFRLQDTVDYIFKDDSTALDRFASHICNKVAFAPQNEKQLDFIDLIFQEPSFSALRHCLFHCEIKCFKKIMFCNEKTDHFSKTL